MSDEGFREIQLNGKQLIFLFMAATVVSVVIFLFGVLVGRGVRSTAAPAEIATADVGPDASPPASAAAPEASPPPPALSVPRGGPASGAGSTTPPAEELSYAERLLRDAPPEEKLKDPAPTPEPLTAKEPAPRQPAPAPAPTRELADRYDPGTCGYVGCGVRSIRPRVCSPGGDLERSSGG